MKREKEEFENKLKEQQDALMKEKIEKERLKSECHFKNINEDPLLSGAVKKLMFHG